MLPSKPPPLDSVLAAPCRVPDAPAVADYDVWQEWVMKDLLGALGECAARHRKAVESWPTRRAEESATNLERGA